MTAGLDAVLPMLVCPHCAGALTRADGVVGCTDRHRFDIARQGYLTLLGPRSRTDTGDTADMVAARQEFLDAGHFAPMTRAIVDAAGRGPFLDLGAGTGHHLRAVLVARDPAAVGLAIDSSIYAARRAARSHPRIGSVLADAWSPLPVRDGVVGTLLNVFAPRDPGRLARLMAPGGRVVVVTPEPDHQAELRDTFDLLAVDPDKTSRLRDAMAGPLTPVGRTIVRHVMPLPRADVDRLIRMGPSAYHLPVERRRAAVAALDQVTEVTLAVTVSVFEAG